jgi:hypothetical protein
MTSSVVGRPGTGSAPRARQAAADPERGAAFLIVMLFMVLMLILVSAMLLFTKNEVIIAGLQRDGVRALECAQAGIEEAVRRLAVPHPVIPGFDVSTDGPNDPCARTSVSLEPVGTPGGSSSYQEIRAESTVGLSTRRLSHLVLTVSASLPPDIVFGYNLATQGSVEVIRGDIYSWTFVQYKNYPVCSPLDASGTLPAQCVVGPSHTYAGWRIRKPLTPPSTPWCATSPCGGEPQRGVWFPGHRRALRQGQTIADAILQGSSGDSRQNTPIESLLSFTCPPGPAGGEMINASYGWVTGDLKQDTTGMPSGAEPLYGCDPDQLPYTYVRETFEDIDGTKSVWFKTILFEAWFNKYWLFDDDSSDDDDPLTCCQGSFRKRYQPEDGGGPDLYSNPRFGTVPPFPDFDAIEASLNQAVFVTDPTSYRTGGDNLTGSTTLVLGCKHPEMSCPGGVSDSSVIWLDNGRIDPSDNNCSGGGTPGYYRIGSNLQGYGTLIVDGDLCAQGTLEWWGTAFIRGAIKRINGNVIIHGGLVVNSTFESLGNLTIDGGFGPGSLPLGPVSVQRRSWWER